MNADQNRKMQAGRGKHMRATGTHCVWPVGVEKRYDISAPTRWRWEKVGLLPARDVFVGGKAIGWKPETLEAAERGAMAGGAA